MSIGGGGGGSGGMPQTPNVPSAGPARAIGSYPQYNPLAYLGMTPGAQPAIPGMGAPIQSYMPAVNGMNGFGGIPATQLIQSLMAGYAGVPNPVQATGAGAPGMSTMTPTTGTTPGAGSGSGNPYPPGSGAYMRWEQQHGGTGFRRGGNVGPANGPAGTASAGDYAPGYWWQGDSGGPSQSGGTDSSSVGADGTNSADNGMGMAGADTNGSSGEQGGGMYARGGPVRALSGPNPKGPDDGYAALDRGEYVVRASQAKKHGKTLRAINAGKFGNKSV